MPTLTLPDPRLRRWTPYGDGEQDALIYKSFNLDFEGNPGKIQLSREGIIHSRELLGQFYIGLSIWVFCI